MNGLRRALAAALLVAAAVAAAPASAAVDTQVGMADDAQMLYGGPAAAQKATTAFKAMGVDTVRLHARWGFIAPRSQDHRMPTDFHPRDPQDPGYNFAALDTAVDLLTAAGIEPIVAVTGSGPVWSSSDPARGDGRFRPSARLFGDFAHAVAARYKGRVHQYLVWNEPNQPGWLLPQFSCRGGRCTPVSPHLYRELFRSAAAGIREVDPAAQVYIGTLAPRGRAPFSASAPMRPLQFIRALGCVKADYTRDRSGPCRTARPVSAAAFSYHPHPVRFSPATSDPDGDDASIADIKRLERALDRTTARGILRPTTGARFNLVFTEFGYQTRPPDPISGVTLQQQAAWVQWSTYLAWRDPRVKNITQYEWIDEPVKTGTYSLDSYAGWQSGLLFSDGRPKPLAHAFPNPFFVLPEPRGRALFWGQVRPGGATKITLQQRVGTIWRTLTTVRTNDHGYWTADRPLRVAGRFRFTYPDPSPDARAGAPGARAGAVVASASQSVRPLR